LIRFQLSDHLGSSSIELDDEAQLLTMEEYSPYGSTTFQASTATLETPKRYRYTGKERDEETGLSYHGARYLAPWLGRWILGDPGGTKDGLNTYTYVNGNPIRMSDPSGYAGETWHDVTIDEILPVGQKGASVTGAEKVWRATAAGNRQFLDGPLNFDKGNQPVRHTAEEQPTEDINLDEHPDALEKLNWAHMKETRALNDQVVAETPRGVDEKGNRESEEAWNKRIRKGLQKGLKRMFREQLEPIGRVMGKLGWRIGPNGNLQAPRQIGHSNPVKPPVFPTKAERKALKRGGGGNSGSAGGTAAPPAPPAPPTEVAPGVKGEIAAPATPHFVVKPPAEHVEAIMKSIEPPEGGLQARMVPTGKMINTTLTGLAVGGAVGAALRDVDQGHEVRAGAMLVANGLLLFAAKRAPIVGWILVAKGTYENLDSKLATDARAATSSAVADATGSELVGAVAGYAAQGTTAFAKALVLDPYNDIKDGVGVLRKWTGW
jgi:RHS repeat-associated protein